MHPPLLRESGEEAPVDLAEVEERIRAGDLGGEATLLHEPWTGEAWRRLDELPALRSAFEAPGARFAAHLRRRASPLGTALLVGVLALCAIGQRLAVQLAPGGGAPMEGATVARRLVRQGGLYWEGVVLDGQWWSVLTAHLLHAPQAPLVHLFFNLPFLLYCGYRVEQAWGLDGLLRVLAGALASSSLAVLLLSDLPTVGSSMLAFGLLGGQIATGFRMGEAIPPRRRGHYGWGSLRAALLFAAVTVGLDVLLHGHAGLSPGVSHLGHMSGLLGGALAVLFGQPRVIDPRRRGDLLPALGLVLLPTALALAAFRLPVPFAGPWAPVEPDGSGLVLRLPARMAAHPVRFGGRPGFAASSDADQAVLVERVLYRSYEALAERDPAGFWVERLGGAVRALDAPPLVATGFVGRAWELQGSPGQLVEEHERIDGLYVSRVAFAIPRDQPAEARRALYREILRRLEVREPADLVAERERFARNPEAPQRRHALAQELLVAGRFAEADALLVPLLARPDGWAWDAARTRLRLLEVHPPSGEGIDGGWVLPFLEAAPATDLAIWTRGIPWLAARGRCEEARRSMSRLRGDVRAWAEGSRDEADERRLSEALARVEASTAGCEAPTEASPRPAD